MQAHMRSHANLGWWRTELSIYLQQAALICYSILFEESSGSVSDLTPVWGRIMLTLARQINDVRFYA
jgi:hypothetical protein